MSEYFTCLIIFLMIIILGRRAATAQEEGMVDAPARSQGARSVLAIGMMNRCRVSAAVCCEKECDEEVPEGSWINMIIARREVELCALNVIIFGIPSYVNSSSINEAIPLGYYTYYTRKFLGNS